jgi:hypothetical protein
MLTLFALATSFTSDAGGADHEEGVNCSSCGTPTRGGPCQICLQRIGNVPASPLQAPAAPGPNPLRELDHGEAFRLPCNLGPPTGGHRDLGESYA